MTPVTIQPHDLTLTDIERDAEGRIVGGWVVNGGWWFEVVDGEDRCCARKGGSIVTRYPSIPFTEEPAP